MPESQLNTASSTQIEIKVNGSPIDEDLKLVDAVMDERAGAAALCVLRFHDESFATLEESAFAPGRFQIGKKLEVHLGLEDRQAKKVFDGEIVSLELEFPEAMAAYAVVRAMDRSHRLTRGRRTRVYNQVTYADVVKKVAQEAALDAQTDDTGVSHEYVVQHNVSDWDFVTELAREVGFDVTFDGSKLLFTKPRAAGAEGSPVPLVWGENLRRLNATATAVEQVKEVVIRGWDPDQQQAVMHTEGINGAKSAVLDDGKLKPGMIASDLGGAPSLVGSGTPYRDAAGARAAAEAAAEEVASAAAELHGVAEGDPNLRLGKAVSLAAGPLFSGTYLLTSVRHIFDTVEGYRTEFAVTGRHDRSLLGLTAGGNGDRHGAATAAPIHGVVIAVVTNAQDPDNLGRLKVQFPWMDDKVESHWARIAQLFVGDGFGSQWMPAVNDEVLVAFEHGDFRRPYIIGALPSKKRKPDKLHADVHKGGEVIRQGLTTKKKSRLAFLEDKAGEVILSAGDEKYVVTLDVDKTKIGITSDGKVEITGKQDITIASDANITMKAKQDVTLEGMNVTIKAKTAGKLEGSTLDVKASGPATVKGNPIQLN